MILNYSTFTDVNHSQPTNIHVEQFKGYHETILGSEYQNIQNVLSIRPEIQFSKTV